MDQQRYHPPTHPPMSFAPPPHFGMMGMPPHGPAGMPGAPPMFRPPQIIQSGPQLHTFPLRPFVPEMFMGGKPLDQLCTVYVGKIPPGTEDEFMKKLLEVTTLFTRLFFSFQVFQSISSLSFLCKW